MKGGGVVDVEHGNEADQLEEHSKDDKSEGDGINFHKSS